MKSERLSAPQQLKRLFLAGVLASAAWLPGAKTVQAQAEPSATFSMDCPSGGYGVLSIDWSGPFPYDVRAESSVEKVSFKRGEPNSAKFDLSMIKYEPGVPGPIVKFSLAYEDGASEAELKRKEIMNFQPEPCP